MTEAEIHSASSIFHFAIVILLATASRPVEQLWRTICNRLDPASQRRVPLASLA
jgi:hypothetical protein